MSNIKLSLENLHAVLLEHLVKLAVVPTENPGKGATLTVEPLQTLLPVEHHEDFRADMIACTVMTTESRFSLHPAVVATNVLPLYANFLAQQIVRGLIYYSPQGVPTSIKITVEPDYLAIAKIEWAYSVLGLDVDLDLPTQGEDSGDVDGN